MKNEMLDLAVFYANVEDPEIKSNDEEMELMRGLSVLMSERQLFSVIMRAKQALSDAGTLDYRVRYELPSSLSVLEVCALFTGNDPCERDLSFATLSFYRLIRLSMCRDGFAKDVLAKVKCNMYDDGAVDANHMLYYNKSFDDGRQGVIADELYWIDTEDLLAVRIPKDAWREWFNTLGEKPPFLYPETWADGTDTTVNLTTETPQADDKIHPKERRALLTIIAALLKSKGIDPHSKGSTSLMIRRVEEIGLTMTEKTMRKHLAATIDLMENEGVNPFGE